MSLLAAGSGRRGGALAGRRRTPGRSRGALAGRWVARAGTGLAIAGLALTIDNLRRLRVPPADPPPPREHVSVLLPVRDEAHRVEACVRALLPALGPLVDLVVLDDGSADGTADVVRRVLGGHPRARVLTGALLPPGWLGKPWACAQLADAAADADVLVFVDADVVVEPHAVAATVALLRSARLDLVSPYPRQLAVTAAERLVQPLLQWSWLTTLPLGLAERSPRPSLTAANGQLLAVDAAALRRAGGHAAIRDAVLDDLALLRAVKRAGGCGGVADGTHVATCRMYSGAREVRDGYAKSLWAAFGSRAGAVAALSVLLTAYVAPPVAMLRGSRAGALGYAAAVAGRVLTARRTRGRAVDAVAHPLSVVALAALTADSWLRRGSVRWKGRRVP